MIVAGGMPVACQPSGDAHSGSIQQPPTQGRENSITPAMERPPSIRDPRPRFKCFRRESQMTTTRPGYGSASIIGFSGSQGRAIHKQGFVTEDDTTSTRDEAAKSVFADIVAGR